MMEQSRLQTQPIFQKPAKAFIKRLHRHHRPPVGIIFAVSVTDGKRVVGVATVGRPVARKLQDRWTVEVTRLCTDGTPNACSKLYAAAWQTARAMGYKRMVTYTLEDEPGTSLKAAGWHFLYMTDGDSWDVPSRPREDKHPIGAKRVWSATPKEQFEADGNSHFCELEDEEASSDARQLVLMI
jgi:hypothetical protein